MKKTDIRKKSMEISKILFDLIISNKLDIFYYIQEITTSERFKIFLYMFILPVVPESDNKSTVSIPAGKANSL